MNLEWPLYLPSLAGDALIDVAAVLFLLFDGRVAGISRIVEKFARIAYRNDGNKRRIRPRSSFRPLGVHGPRRS